MALEDPFFVVKDEVLKALMKTRDLYESWRMGEEGRDLRSADEQEWATTELRNSLRSIEWDLEDLDDTVQIVEKNPAKFRIDPSELAARKAFILQTRNEVNTMKETTENGGHCLRADHHGASLDTVCLASPTSFGEPSTQGSSSSQLHHHLIGGVLASSAMAGGGTTKYSRLASEADSPTHNLGNLSGPTANLQQDHGRRMAAHNHSHAYRDETGASHLVQQHQQYQDQLMAQQDSRLQVMSESVGNLRNVSHQIGAELDEQAVMLDEFGTEIENAESKLDATMRKMAKVLHMSNDRRQWMAIGALSSATIVLLIVIFAL